MPFSISILGLGRVTDGFDEVYAHYIKLIKPHTPVSFEFLRPTAAKSLDSTTLMEREGRQLMERWPHGAWPVVLSPEGRRFDTPQFAAWLAGHRSAGRALVFTVGGAFGLSPAIKKEARESISLSGMTMAHRVCVTVLLEQVYRAITILSGHPYHK